MKKTPVYITSILCALLVLPGCSRVQKELGIGRHSPDEFTVIKRAPLSLPPEYDILPPDPDNPRAQELKNQNTKRAENAVFGVQNAQTDKEGKKIAPENALLKSAGAQYADPDIRKTLDRETGYVLLEDEKKLSEKILFWQEEQDDASVINAKKEAERLKENQEEGRAINAGDVPTIQKKKGTIDRLF